MNTLFIDIETYSGADLAKTGVYPYAAHPGFDLLLFAYATDTSPEVRVVDLAQGEHLPDEIIAALVDPGVVKWAHNAAFERICLSTYLARNYPDVLAGREFLDATQWRCTMVACAYLGLPLSLGQAAQALRLPVEKDTAGKKLIKYFCMPTKDGTRHHPSDDPEGWARFVEYNRRDVEVEMAIHNKISRFPPPETEWQAYALDQAINDRGIRIDAALVDNAINLEAHHRQSAMERARGLTGLDNPNSPLQLKAWLNEHGCALDAMTKDDITHALDSAHGVVKEVLELRAQLAKSSVKKYQAMRHALGVGGRGRGFLQFYGAGRTGRFAGRLVQVQNLPRNHMSDLEAARMLVKNGDYEALTLLYDSLPDTLSQLIRTAFIPTPGNRFIVADYSAIEARVIAWLAGEQPTLEAFREGKDLYCETASRMFGVPVEKHGENGELRQKGKIAVLACGYGGSVGALKAMGALSMGIAERDLQGLVDTWRAANPNIVRLWNDVEAAALDVIRTRSHRRVRNLVLSVEAGIFFIELPSGRRLSYVQPGLGENRFGGTSITYSGQMPNKKWGRLETYGGKLVENIVQAIARDILVDAMVRLDKAGHAIVMHVHDEIIIDTPSSSVEEICTLMSQTPAWAPGLPLDADGYECAFYKKD